MTLETIARALVAYVDSSDDYVDTGELLNLVEQLRATLADAPVQDTRDILSLVDSAIRGSADGRTSFVLVDGPVRGTRRTFVRDSLSHSYVATHSEDVLAWIHRGRLTVVDHRNVSESPADPDA